MKEKTISFIIYIEKDCLINCFDASSPLQSIKNIPIKNGFYLVFASKRTYKERNDYNFFEILYNNFLYLVRFKDIKDRII